MLERAEESQRFSAFSALLGILSASRRPVVADLRYSQPRVGVLQPRVPGAKIFADPLAHKIPAVALRFSFPAFNHAHDRERDMPPIGFDSLFGAGLRQVVPLEPVRA